MGAGCAAATSLPHADAVVHSDLGIANAYGQPVAFPNIAQLAYPDDDLKPDAQRVADGDDDINADNHPIGFDEPDSFPYPVTLSNPYPYSHAIKHPYTHTNWH
jgi:hypothetical protein